MKKLVSFTLALIMCFSVFSVASFATEENTRKVTSVELHTVKYYEAVKTQEEIAGAAFYVDFVAYFDDGTSVAYNSQDGWADPSVTSIVSWFIQPETDENFGDQQSLYLVIDGEEYWAGYTHVEVDQWKALFRSVVTWDWVTPEVVETAGVIAKALLTMYVAFQWFIDTIVLGLLINISI